MKPEYGYKVTIGTESQERYDELMKELEPTHWRYTTALDTFTAQLNKRLSNQFEDQVKLALSFKGFEFKTETELRDFCGSDRCRMHLYTEKRQLLIDNVIVCEWDLTPRITQGWTDRQFTIKAEGKNFKIF